MLQKVHLSLYRMVFTRGRAMHKQSCTSNGHPKGDEFGTASNHSRSFQELFHPSLSLSTHFRFFFEKLKTCNIINLDCEILQTAVFSILPSVSTRHFKHITMKMNQAFQTHLGPNCYCASLSWALSLGIVGGGTFLGMGTWAAQFVL